ncbi:unnamed protein product [Urochloa decumbens]|uniref:Uncharacterized protein n=1 Tax=Urochloa decumbens TaxID=240449 RepID=A0ABC8VXC1_9POAL
MAAAVVSASTGVISTLLPKLSLLIEGEYKLQKGVKRKIKFLKDELTSMETLLVKLSDKEETLDVQAKDWRNKVRELSYDIEDCIDLFTHKMSKGTGAEANLVKKTTSKIKKIWSRHKIANLIEELKVRVQEESVRRMRYKFDDPATNYNQVVRIDPRLPALFVEAERHVGIDGPREEIIDWLTKDDYAQQLKVVSILGFGGLGKTTLANQIYQKIKGQFDCSCFVPVSRNPNIAKILADMLKELKNHQSCVDPSDDVRQLIDKLRAFLTNKRYFIIVDDIWTTQAWEIVKSALPENNLNSRIITTTRIASVAESCCSCLVGYVYKIQPLSDQQSQQLFFKRVFGDACACPPHLEEMSHGILEKCHGLPLAIITIASLLIGKSNKDQWKQVYNSISSAFSDKGMRDILLLSYYDLPHHLKTCLLYLSMYPEDYEIEREELIWKWIAEGFVAEVKGQTLDQVAENYFNELINRSLIQPVHIKYDGRAHDVRVHDMVLELIVFLSTEGNFASMVEKQSYNGGGHMIRRLSIQSEHVGDEVMQEIMDKWSQVRSISFYGLQEQGIPHSKELYSLRVLDFDNSSHIGNQYVKYIGSFFRLTFLHIGCREVTELPKGIGDLRYLQTLDILRSGIRKLPPSIGRLQKLVRLVVSNCVELPDEIGDLQALQELPMTYYNCSIKFVETLRRLTKLKTLGIDLLGRGQLACDMGRYEEAFKSSLAAMGKHGLQSLCITKSNFLEEELMDILCCTAPCLRELVVQGACITRLSKQMVSLVNLTYLKLYMKRIKQDDLCIIGGIPALLFTNLSVAHAPDEHLTIRSNQFRCLKEFRFSSYNAQGGMEMLFLQEAMPELRRLYLNLIFEAKETVSKMGFEFSFEHLASLEHISVAIWSFYDTSRVESAEAAIRNATRMETAEAAIRNAVSIHPGRPTLVLKAERSHLKSKDEGEDRSGHGMDEVLEEQP